MQINSEAAQWLAKQIKTAQEAEMAYKVLKDDMGDTIEGGSILEAVSLLISQRDNARHYSDTFRAKLQELGHTFV